MKNKDEVKEILWNEMYVFQEFTFYGRSNDNAGPLEAF